MLHGYPQAKFCQESLSYGINSMLYNVGNQIWSQLFIDHQQGTKKILFLCLISEIFYMILDFPSEKAMAPHSSTLAWRIPGTREPGGLPSMGSHRVGHNWRDLAAAAADFPCKEKMQHVFQWKMRPKPKMETRSWEQQSFHRLLRHVL